MIEQLPHVFWVILGFVVGACVGSFLTVVVVRLPKMLTRDWMNDYAEMTGEPVEPSPSFNLALPQSHCRIA